MKRNILGGGEVCRRKPAMASFLCSRRSSHLPEKCLGLTILDLTIFGFDNIGFDNIGFDYMAIGKFAINNIGLHIIANGNIGIGRQSYSWTCLSKIKLLESLWQRIEYIAFVRVHFPTHACPPTCQIVCTWWYKFVWFLYLRGWTFW